MNYIKNYTSNLERLFTLSSIKKLFVIICILILSACSKPGSDEKLDTQLVEPKIFISNMMDTAKTAEEIERLKLWQNVKFEPKNNFEFYMHHGEKVIKCSYMKRSTNNLEKFHQEIFNCFELYTDGKRMGDYGPFVLNDSNSNKKRKVFTWIYNENFGFQFNEIEHFNLFNESIDESKNNYDGLYNMPLTSEGSIYSYSGILDNIYKDDLVISDNTFTLNPELTLFTTQLTAKLGSAVEMFTNSKKAGMGVGCIIGGFLGGLGGLAVDLYTAGATVAMGSATAQGATGGCLIFSSIGYMTTPEYDRRITCTVYNGIDSSDYVVCQEWEKEVKDRSSSFNGYLQTPLIGSVRILTDPDHIEIYFPDQNQKVSFLIAE